MATYTPETTFDRITQLQIVQEQAIDALGVYLNTMELQNQLHLKVEQDASVRFVSTSIKTVENCVAAINKLVQEQVKG